MGRMPLPYLHFLYFCMRMSWGEEIGKGNSMVEDWRSEPGNVFGTVFHQPFRCGGCSAYPYAFSLFEPFPLQFSGIFDMVSVGIDVPACFIENASVAAFLSGNSLSVFQVQPSALSLIEDYLTRLYH